MVLIAVPKKNKLRGRLEKKDISKSGVAQVIKREHPPCWCGRATYRLNANEPEVCTGCNNGTGLCDCKPLNLKSEMLRG